MRINVAQDIRDYTNNNLKEGDHDLTFRELFSMALNSNLPDEVLTADQKAKAFGLTLRIYANDEVSLTVDEAAFIKERVGKVGTPLVYGRVCELLDGTLEQKAPQAA